MSEVVSIAVDGEGAARGALERCIFSGGVAIFPADGLYGVACDPLRAASIERIHSIKGRDDGKPSAVMYFSPLAMRELLTGLGERSREAIGALLPGALTLVLANPDHRYPLACRADPERIGVRLIGGPLVGASCPIFQTSANRSSAPAPADFSEIDPTILAAVDLAIDGGELTGRPSTVVDLTAIENGGGWTILREGAVPTAELERTLERVGLGSEGRA
jgi:L-threonylcarbamoyladenylate synthase